MADNIEILKKSIEIAQSNGVSEIISQMRKGTNYQIRFSNSEIDNSKIWSEDYLEVFLAKGQKTTQIEIEAPTLEKIEKMITQSALFIEKMPKSFLYNGMETKLRSYPTIEGHTIFAKHWC
jgi:predicted Zn-dependent protease